jgi:hypothetical protein
MEQADSSCVYFPSAKLRRYPLYGRCVQGPVDRAVDQDALRDRERVPWIE